MLTGRQIELLRESFAQMSADAEGAATAFYERLFELDERLRFLFPEDLADQRRLLIFMIGYVVRRAHLWSEIAPRMRNLGIRHTSYGVTSQDYQTFGAAMQQVLAERFELNSKQETLQAWSTLFTAVSEAMLDATEIVLATEEI